MYKKIFIKILLLQSTLFSFQTISASLILNQNNEDLPKIYLSKNRIPQGFNSQILSNIKFVQSNKKNNLSFVSSFYLDENKAEIFEIGLIYRIKSHELLIGMIDNKDYDFLGINEHIIFGENHEPLKKITFQSSEYLSLPFLNNISFFNNITFTYNFSNALLDKNYQYLWDDFYWQEAKEIYYSKEPRLHYKKVNFKYEINELTNFQLGLNHAAIWGGTVVNVTNDTTIVFPNDFNSLHKVIFWQSGTEEYDRNDIVGGVIGNHLGSIDFSINHDNFKYYYQHIFEDGGSFWFDNTIDGLWGMNVINKNSESFFKEISLEFLKDRKSVV